MVQDVFSVSKKAAIELKPHVAELKTGRCLERLVNVRYLSDSASSGDFDRLLFHWIMRGSLKREKSVTTIFK